MCQSHQIQCEHVMWALAGLTWRVHKMCTQGEVSKTPKCNKSDHVRHHELCIGVLDIPSPSAYSRNWPVLCVHAMQCTELTVCDCVHFNRGRGVTHTPWAPSSSSSPPSRMSGGARDTDALRRVDAPLCWWHHHREGHRERMKTETVLKGWYMYNTTVKKKI